MASSPKIDLKNMRQAPAGRKLQSFRFDNMISHDRPGVRVDIYRKPGFPMTPFRDPDISLVDEIQHLHYCLPSSTFSLCSGNSLLNDVISLITSSPKPPVLPTGLYWTPARQESGGFSFLSHPKLGWCTHYKPP